MLPGYYLDKVDKSIGLQVALNVSIAYKALIVFNFLQVDKGKAQRH